MSTPSAPPTSCKELLHAVDWAATQLGPYESWSVSLRSYVAMVMDMPTPAILFWGPDQIQLYNDGYAVIMGPRHPRYFGAPYRECWPDTYPVIHPWMQRVLGGDVVSVDKTLFDLTRHGFLEEAYFTFTFSPLRDDDGTIRGILQPVVEVTDDVLRARRDATLHQLQRIPENADIVQHALEIAAANPHDIPSVRFASSPDGGESAGSAGMHVVPVMSATSPTVHGALTFGISPRLRFDDAYRQFFAAFAREVAMQLDARAARQEADAERRRLQSVFMQAPFAIGILSGPDYTISLANPTICQIWDRPLEAVLGKGLFDAIPELSGQGIRELLDRVRTSGQPFTGTEIPMSFRRTAGREPELHYFSFVYHPLADESGAVTAVIGVGVNVTAQVLARQAAEHLAGDLDVARRDAEQANSAKDEFLAMLGHELRNPLAPIFTALELMQLREIGAVREIEVIERQARHLAVLVDDLLDVSRITRGKIELDRQRLLLSDIIREAVETAAPVFEKRRHQLDVDVDATLEVEADRARLTQVFANLLTNAAKYSNTGGRVRVHAHVTDGKAVVDVTDNGRGIAPDILPRVFEMFVQERQNIDRAQGGLGLGLAIVKTLVTLHGGTVEARSDGPGQGSTFSVRLPLAAHVVDAAAQTSASMSTPRIAGSPPRQRLLVVDDNDDAASLLCAALELAGHACTVAHDGLEALSLARAAAYDAVLLDIGLPAMDGYEVARHLRALPGWAQVPLVAITGYGQYSDRQRSLEAGFNHHLVKPVNLATLVQLLDQELGTATSSRSQ